MPGSPSPAPLQAFDVVVVPFPFTDRQAGKRRPALVLSNPGFNQASRHAVLAMTTTAGQSVWPGDFALRDLAAAGVSVPRVVRMKFFTLDERLILRVCGRLAAADQKRLHAAWRGLLALS